MQRRYFCISIKRSTFAFEYETIIDWNRRFSYCNHFPSVVASAIWDRPDGQTTDALDSVWHSALHPVIIYFICVNRQKEMEWHKRTVAVSCCKHPDTFGYGTHIAIMVYMGFSHKGMVLHGWRILGYQLSEGMCRSCVAFVLYLDIADIQATQLSSATGAGGGKSHQPVARRAPDRRAVDCIRWAPDGMCNQG